MSDTKVFTGYAKDKKLSFGTITQLSWTKEQYKELGQYFNASGYINVDLMRSRNGAPYMQVNTYGLDNIPTPSEQSPIADQSGVEDDVPF